jgi:predicted transcriptional regulator
MVAFRFQSVTFIGSQEIQGPDIMQYFASVRVGKTQIVYSCNLDFYTVVPYMDMLIKNGLVERADGEHIRHRTTPKGGETAANAL